MEISFLYPRYLFFLFLIPLFIFIHFATLKASRSTALKFANFDAIARIKGVDFFSKNIIILSISVLIVFLLIMAVSGLTYHTVVNTSSYSFVIAVDASQSMEANDVAPDRMSAAKKAAGDFIDSLPFGTRVGVVSFSGNALIEQDVTDSKSLVRGAIDNIGISSIGGTDIIEAVITSTNLLKGEDSKAIILLSDGQINVGGTDEVIQYANKNDVVIHTIAIGTEEGGATSYGISKADLDTLEALSYNTDGASFMATDVNEIYDSFNNAITLSDKKISINLSVYLLVACIILFSLEYFLINGRYRRLV